MKLENLGFPKADLAVLPTPFEEAPRFSEALGGGARVFVKRDDSTGLAFGGNKARKLELLIGDALATGSDTVITCGGPQSNHARMTAAAARKVGLEPVLVLDGDDPHTRQGNLLLDHLLGAELVFAGARDSAEMMPVVAERLKAAGKRPYIVPLGGSNALGALGYVSCIEELVGQASEAGLVPQALYAATGSCGTLAGLVLGKILFDAPFGIVGVAVSPNAERKQTRTLELVLETAALLKSHAISSHTGPFERLRDVTPESVKPLIKVVDDQVGEGYGIPTAEGLEAITLLARKEGILTDPVYTGKALAGLCKDVRRGVYRPGDPVIFLHTGGAPANFAYREALTEGRN